MTDESDERVPRRAVRRHRFELVLALGLVLLCVAVFRWQAPGTPLTPQEIERYIEIVDAQLPVPARDREDWLARLRDFGEHDDGRPVYILNLMRYHEELLRD